MGRMPDNLDRGGEGSFLEEVQVQELGETMCTVIKNKSKKDAYHEM